MKNIENKIFEFVVSHAFYEKGNEIVKINNVKTIISGWSEFKNDIYNSDSKTWSLIDDSFVDFVLEFSNIKNNIQINGFSDKYSFWSEIKINNINSIKFYEI
ncbi:hypothetical protein [Fluviispira sanaruensis]|nr:hypothetical protein [Fluviispira sanaruensis]